jgi:hypothetical protein
LPQKYDASNKVEALTILIIIQKDEFKAIAKP